MFCHFWDIQCRKMLLPWNPSHRSLKVIGTDTYGSVIYDFLLTFHSNYNGPISFRFRDKRRFQSKIAKFPHLSVFCAPAKGVPLGIEYRCSGSKTRVMGLPGRERSWRYFQPYTNVTDGRIDGHRATAKTALMHSVARYKGNHTLRSTAGLLN